MIDRHGYPKGDREWTRIKSAEMTLRHKEGGEDKPQPQMDADSFGVVTNDSYRRAFFASRAVVSIRGPFLRSLRSLAAI